jgi:acetylornithine deacetylase
MNAAMGQPRTKPESTINLLRDLIRIPSVNPTIEEGYDETEIAGYIADWFRKTGQFRVIEQPVDKSRYNVIAILKGKGHGKSLMLNGHMDTVGTSYMTVNPFRPSVKAGRIFGRGSSDMKGPLAAMMSAVLALANSRERLAGDLLFAAVVDEEYESKGTAQLVKRFRADAGIVGEPTDMDVAIAHKGYAWLEIETTGKEAHGSVPEQGVDAIEKMASLVTRLGLLRKQHKSVKHALVGFPRIHTSTISGGSEWSTVPGKCVLRLERRLVPGENPADALNEIRSLIQQASRGDKSLKAKVRLIHHAASMEVNEREPPVQLLLNNARRIAGRGRVVGVPYWTDAAILVNQAKIPSCLFGPGNIRVAHSKDENIRIADVLMAAGIYAATAQQYCR